MEKHQTKRNHSANNNLSREYMGQKYTFLRYICAREGRLTNDADKQF